jgi:hypothetical protein
MLKRIEVRTFQKTLRFFSSQKAQIPLPGKEQLQVHYISNALPMIGFGLVDQTGECP